jgi:hypothetical protein
MIRVSAVLCLISFVYRLLYVQSYLKFRTASNSNALKTYFASSGTLTGSGLPTGLPSVLGKIYLNVIPSSSIVGFEHADSSLIGGVSPATDSTDPQQLWRWWRQKGITESALKSAIQSGKNESELTSFFEAHKAFLKHEKKEILLANEQFFRAQSTGDLTTMNALWVRSDRAVCSTNVYVQVSTSPLDLFSQWDNFKFDNQLHAFSYPVGSLGGQQRHRRVP